MIEEPIWTPSPERIADSQLTQFMNQVQERYNLPLYSYFDLHRWSIEKPDQFWSAVWSFCDIKASQSFEEALVDGDKFPGAKWFTGNQLNFAENLLRSASPRCVCN